MTLQLPGGTIGVIGGGQLGRMLIQSAKRLGFRAIVLDPAPDAPAGQVADEQIVADYGDRMALEQLASQTQVLTFEFEHIDAEVLLGLETQGYQVTPSSNTLMKFQNKYIQKLNLQKAGLPVPDLWLVQSPAELEHILRSGHVPLMLKAATGGYDGKGNLKVADPAANCQTIWQALGQRPFFAEAWVPFERELSVVYGRDQAGRVVSYPIVENMHQDSILIQTQAPAQLSADVLESVHQLVQAVSDWIDDAGVYCIELFLLADQSVLINEIAPRPHNSGHYTIEACYTSQFDQLVRILAGLPMGSTDQHHPAVMVNLLGDEATEGPFSMGGLDNSLADGMVYLHLYGKEKTSPRRKIGHLTALGHTVAQAELKARRAREALTIKPPTDRENSK